MTVIARRRPADANALEFVRICALRAAQLMRGCTPRLEASTKPCITAQREVALGLVLALPRADGKKLLS
jgi:DNA-directed RNA polymerase subunit K/omega